MHFLLLLATYTVLENKIDKFFHKAFHRSLTSDHSTLCTLLRNVYYSMCKTDATVIGN